MDRKLNDRGQIRRMGRTYKEKEEEDKEEGVGEEKKG